MDFTANQTHILAPTEVLDLKKTFECGQCFRWEADGKGCYTGVAYGKALRVWAEGGSVCCNASAEDLSFWRYYFDLDTDYTNSLRLFSQPDYLRQCRDFGLGIRILRQEPWEALVSFLISQCNNIPRIRGIVSALCRLFGTPLEDGLFAFPAPEQLAGLPEAALAPIKSGYRAKYIVNAARAVSEGSLDFQALSTLPDEVAFSEIRQLSGVGEKVANCFLLYGLHRLGRFPVDVWMRRALDRHFPRDFDPAVLGKHAGLAQQFIFYYTRTNEGADRLACEIPKKKKNPAILCQAAVNEGL